MADLTQPLFLDATVLSNFASSDSVDWLTTLLENPVAVPAVRTELKKGLEHGYGFLDRAIDQLGSEIPVLEVNSNTRGPDESELRTRIDLSEAESLLGAITQYVRAILFRTKIVWAMFSWITLAKAQWGVQNQGHLVGGQPGRLRVTPAGHAPG